MPKVSNQYTWCRPAAFSAVCRYIIIVIIIIIIIIGELQGA